MIVETTARMEFASSPCTPRNESGDLLGSQRKRDVNDHWTVPVKRLKPDDKHSTKWTKSAPIPFREFPEQISNRFVERLVNYLAVNITQPILDDALTSDDLFWRQQVPKVPLTDYLHRMIRYINVWESGVETDDAMAQISKQVYCSRENVGIRAAICGLIYLCRLSSVIPITSNSIHRALLTAVLLGVKFTEDYPITLNFWAKVGGLSKQRELEGLELFFCKQINFELFISDEEYNHLSGLLSSCRGPSSARSLDFFGF